MQVTFWAYFTSLANEVAFKDRPSIELISAGVSNDDGYNILKAPAMDEFEMLKQTKIWIAEVGFMLKMSQTRVNALITTLLKNQK